MNALKLMQPLVCIFFNGWMNGTELVKEILGIKWQGTK